jgi:hypothetical protein
MTVVFTVLALAGSAVVVLFCCGGLALLSARNRDTMSQTRLPIENTPKSKSAQQSNSVTDKNRVTAITNGDANTTSEKGESSNEKPSESDSRTSSGKEPSATSSPNAGIPAEFAGELPEGDKVLGPMRDWSSADGKFHRSARYVSSGGSSTNRHITLRKEDGKEIQVEEKQLSEEDHKWLTAYLEWKHRGRKQSHKKGGSDERRSEE